MVWLAPAVKLPLCVLLQTASTSQEPAVATLSVVEIVVPEATVAMASAAGAVWETPLRAVEPPRMPMTAPAKVTATV